MPAKIVSPEEWRAARLDLLKKEKEHTKRTDELTALRAALPMTKITKSYTFTGPTGPVALADLFAGRRQLIVQHVMFDPEWKRPCRNCTFGINQLPRRLEYLHDRDTSLVLISRAPIEKLMAVQKEMGWEGFEWYSSHGSDFNYDFHVTQDADVAPVEYNYYSGAELEAKKMPFFTRGEQPGFSVFTKEGEDVLHSYSCYARGSDNLMVTAGLLDLTPLGRQDTDGADWKYPDQY